MKAQKVVKIEVKGVNWEHVTIVFGIEGAKREFGFGCMLTRRIFTETARYTCNAGEALRLEHFNGWTIPAPTIHATETLVDAVERVMREAAGWDQQDEEDFPVPSMSGGSRTRGRLAMAA